MGQWQRYPERVDDWLALEATLRAAAQVEEQHADGVRFLRATAGLSVEGARAVLDYRKAQDEYWKAQDLAAVTASSSSLCKRREELRTKEALALAIKNEVAAHSELIRIRAEGAYGVLSTEDAAKLRQYVTKAKSGMSVFQVTNPVRALAHLEPAAYFNKLCGGAR